MQSTDRRPRAFRLYATGTITTIYILILLGGIVRSTGSGLGCPDWPRCFGRWVPPTQLAELPADYKMRYGHGLQPEKVTFNPVKTWIEYLNRLAGAITGLVVVVAALLALRAYGVSAISVLSITAVLLTGVQGYLGAKVVSSALAPHMISLHMLLAQLIVFLLIAAYWLSHFANAKWKLKNVDAETKPQKPTLSISILSFLAVFTQMFLGIHVRQQVDFLTNTVGLLKEQIPPLLDDFFYIHRSLSIAIMALVVWQGMKVIRENAGSPAAFLYKAAMALVLAESLLGVTLYYLALPAASQALHLLLGSLLLGALFSIVIVGFLNRTSRKLVL